jgi:hypothetical protein
MLTLCSKCRQFHRRDEDTCPFCGTASQVLKAAVLGAAVALGGCSREPPPAALYGAPPMAKTNVPPPEPYNVPVAEYGVPPMARVRPPPPVAAQPDAGAEPPAVKPEPRPVPVPAYGVVPVPPRPEKPKKP